MLARENSVSIFNFQLETSNNYLPVSGGLNRMSGFAAALSFGLAFVAVQPYGVATGSSPKPAPLFQIRSEAHQRPPRLGDAELFAVRTKRDLQCNRIPATLANENLRVSLRRLFPPGLLGSVWHTHAHAAPTNTHKHQVINSMIFIYCRESVCCHHSVATCGYVHVLLSEYCRFLLPNISTRTFIVVRTCRPPHFDSNAPKLPVFAIQ